MYSAKKQIIILTIFLFFQACRQSVNEKERLDLVNKDTIGLSKNVIIKGVTDDSKAFDYLNFINYSYFNGTNHDELYTENFGDTTRFSLESINQPQIIELFSFGDSINYNTRLFVIPGDTVSMSFKNGNINFNGKNANHYSFFKELDSTNTEWAKNKFKGNFKDYKNGCKSIYERRKLFLEEYISNNQVSPEFVEQIESELKFEYLYNLIAPRFIATESGLSANEQEFITLVNLFSDIEKDGFFNLKDYFGPITIEEFQKPELINNDYFKRCLISFIRYYFSNSDFVDYTKDDFVEEQEYIQNNLNGELKEYALTRLIYDYYKKGFGQGKIDNQFVVDFIRKQTNEISNPAYEEILHQIEEELGLIGYKLPEKVIDDRFVGLDGDTLTFANLLKKTTSKIKVLDFWANWCSPCISEIKKTGALRSELKANNNLEWIFISIDGNNNKWANRYEELRPFFKNEPQYRLLDANKSQILKFLMNGNSDAFLIPRYVIIDSNNEVILSHAPRPSDSLVFKNIIRKSSPPPASASVTLVPTRVSKESIN